MRLGLYTNPDQDKCIRAVGLDTVLINPADQEIWQGTTTFSLRAANKRRNECLLDQQRVSTYIVPSNVQKKLMGTGVVVLVGGENSYA